MINIAMTLIGPVINLFTKKDSSGTKSANWQTIAIAILVGVIVILGALLLWEKYQHRGTKLTLQEQVALTTAYAIDIETLKGNIQGLEVEIAHHTASVSSVSDQLKKCYEAAGRVQHNMDEVNRILSGDTSGYVEEHPTDPTAPKEQINVKTVTTKQVQAGFEFINRQFDSVK